MGKETKIVKKKPGPDPAAQLRRALKAMKEEKKGPKKRARFLNIKTEVDGITFDSKKEARRYSELKLRLQAREIENLKLQEPFPCKVNGRVICTYRADFSYYDRLTGQQVVEDVKSPRTRKLPEYRLKKALVEALYPFTITEIV